MRLFILFLVAFNGAIASWFLFVQYQEANQKPKVLEHDLSTLPRLMLKADLDRERGDAVRPVVDSGSDEVEAESETPLAVPAQGVEEYTRCWLIGPYAEIVSARTHENFITKAGLKAIVRESVEEQPALYWVYITPYSNQKKAVNALQQLQKNNKESYVVTEGEFANAISLGVFRIEASAVKIKQDVMRLGFDVKIKLRKKEIKAFWLSIDQELAPADFDIMQSENILLKKEEKPCEDVALLKRIL